MCTHNTLCLLAYVLQSSHPRGFVGHDASERENEWWMATCNQLLCVHPSTTCLLAQLETPAHRGARYVLGTHDTRHSKPSPPNRHQHVTPLGGRRRTPPSLYFGVCTQHIETPDSVCRQSSQSRQAGAPQRTPPSSISSSDYDTPTNPPPLPHKAHTPPSVFRCGCCRTVPYRTVRCFFIYLF